MTLEIELTEEQEDCLNDVATEQGVTPEAFCVELVMATVRNITKNAYDKSVSGLGAAAQALPYADRKALIAQVAAQLQS